MPQLVSSTNIPITSRKSNGKRKASSLERVAAAGSSREEANKRQRIRGKLNDLRQRVEFVCTMPVQNPKECIAFLFDREPDLNDMLRIADIPTQQDVSQLFVDIQYTRPLTTENLACPVGKRFTVDGVILEKLDNGSFRKVSEEAATTTAKDAFRMTEAQAKIWNDVYGNKLAGDLEILKDFKVTEEGVSMSKRRSLDRWPGIMRKDLDNGITTADRPDERGLYYFQSSEALLALFVTKGLIMTPEQATLYDKIVAWQKQY